jgi:hypothetical protein
MTINAVVLAALSAWVLTVTSPEPQAVSPPKATGQPVIGADKPVQSIPRREALLRPIAPHFGLAAPDVPWSPTNVDRLAAQAGRRPTLMQYFVSWTREFDPKPVRLAYQQGAIPVISWEPWAGLRKGENQPTYALRKIAGGRHDAYLTRFATAVRDQSWTIGIRLAHEMNGNWYPWSEKRSGNRAGDYVRAWRHVHDLFRKVGATNVIWIWSPNIIRPLPSVQLEPLYPGDAYVDWVGIVGYGVERSASQTFDPTIGKIRRFTQLPLLITETGAHPGPNKSRWTANLFTWLGKRKDVVGFVWFEFSGKDGGTADWRFDSDRRTRAAFRQGLATTRLAEPVAA